ncbi:MAG: hypothetical protein PWQ97_1703 [Tepidanaerobacteraceae bacterium]|nr:hypothetical protein [Tepidanaerobacteraceae bacterium]MDK2878291.1 hypothetical protein [Thermoanaerobacteraceae bacterium]
MKGKGFYTFTEYMKKEERLMSAAMEDYLEMIYRLSKETGFTRINELAQALNIKPPSATKMAQKLAELKLINYEKYNIITLQPRGRKLGRALIKRHDILEEFLKILKVPGNLLLEEVEKMEHTLSTGTVKRIEFLMKYLKEHSEILENIFSK